MAGVDIKMPLEKEAAPKATSAYKLMLKGLAGGHSGVDIDKGRANANILMARLLDALYDKISLLDIRGGGKMNAIPRECSAGIFIAGNRLAKIKALVEQKQIEFKAAFPHDPELTLTLKKTLLDETPSSGLVVSRPSLRRLIDTILNMPNGVQSMSPRNKGLVQTSSNLAVIETVDNTLKVKCSLRSSAAGDRDIVIAKMRSLAKGFGAKAEVSIGFPAWEYKENSPLRDTMAAVYRELYGKAPAFSSVHAGLECALFAQKIPDGDFSSIGGPNIVDMHSPDERMSLSSFYRTWDYICKVLERL
jgi:dipeptidase D